MSAAVANSRSHGGFTLVEMLAVVMLLGLVSSVAVVSLAGADETGALQSARWGFVNLDAQARLAARTDGAAVVIRLLDGGARAVASVTPASEGAWSASFDCPRSTLARFFERDGGQELDGIIIDRTGRSADVSVQVFSASGRSERWFIHGLTGEISRDGLNGTEP
ncbi:MAG: prepilin-type N-terminal cleavage/methylation domain-containing protein [Phycisphaerales bacterium]|nr:prepilin-type N-terminal cleavage/methylation domain-containing protein [Phycisphaerales bacterium]